RPTSPCFNGGPREYARPTLRIAACCMLPAACFFRPRLHVEQPKNLLLVESQRRRRPVLAEHLLEERPLLLQHLGDAPFDRILADETLDEDGLLLPDAMGAVDRLVLNGGVP